MRAIALSITTILAAAPAWAQQSPAPTTAAPAASTPGPAGTAHKARPHASTRAAARHESDVDHQIAEMHSKLGITADQEQQWGQFAQQLRDNATQAEQLYHERAEKLSTMSAVDNLQSFAQIETQRAQAMQKLASAFQGVYASLSDQQKKAADEWFRSYGERRQLRRQHHAAAR